jgi:hypothetical protein
MSKFIGRLLVVLAFGWAGSVSSQVPITGNDIVTVDGTDWVQLVAYPLTTYKLPRYNQLAPVIASTSPFSAKYSDAIGVRCPLSQVVIPVFTSPPK